MNPYFWFFAVYALLITPVKVHGGVRISHGVRWRLRFVVAGVPVMLRRKENNAQEEKALEIQQLFTGLLFSRRKLMMALVRDGTIRRLLGAFRWDRLHVYARLSFADASATALGYALVRTVLEILRRCGALPAQISGFIGADFRAQGTELEVQGIISARLGKIILEGIRLCISALRHSAEFATEEKQYAASH